MIIRSMFRLGLASLCLFPACFAGFAADWSHYRGPNHNGISTDRITTNWTGSVTNPLWQVSFTNGLSGLTVGGGRVFTQVKRNLAGDKEVCLALDADRGTELWATPVDIASYPNGGVGPDDGPRSTPVVDGDSVYVLSSYLNLLRLHATNGAVVWSNNLVSLYSARVIGWQNAASPLVDNGLVFVNANAGVECLMAFRTSDVSLAWRKENLGMTHSTPVLATIHGVPQLVFATQGGLVSVDPETGSRLWLFSYPFSYSTSLAPSPVVHEDVVFQTAAHGYGMGSFAVQIHFNGTTWSAQQLWYKNLIASHWMTPLCHEGFLYGHFGILSSYDSPRAQLKCLDLRTGQERWSRDNFGRAGVILVDRHLVSLTESNELVLIQPNPDAYTELARFQALPPFNALQSGGPFNRAWNHPSVSEGRIYARSTAYGAAFDLSPSLLRMDRPAIADQRTVELTVRSTTAAPLSEQRVAGMTLHYATDPSEPVTTWPSWPGPWTLTNGVAACSLPWLGEDQSWFLIREPAGAGPPLKLDPPGLRTQRTLRVVIRTTNGKPLTPERVAALSLRFTTNLSLPAATWPAWPSSVMLSNGVGVIGNIPVDERGEQWFLVSESE
jgi:outer membrane protein assembly factor BamB